MDGSYLYITFFAAAVIVVVVSAAATSVQRPPWLWNIVGVGLFFILPYPHSTFWRVVACIVIVFAIMLIDKAIEQWRESVKPKDDD